MQEFVHQQYEQQAEDEAMLRARMSGRGFRPQSFKAGLCILGDSRACLSGPQNHDYHHVSNPPIILRNIANFMPITVITSIIIIIKYCSLQTSASSPKHS